MTTEAPHLSVVIPARDAAGTIGEQLDALCAQTWTEPWEIVVVDNRSSDATGRIVAERATHDRRVRLVTARARAGVAYARNVGIDATSAPTIAMCDADDVVGPGWVAAMGEALRHHDLVTGPLEVERLNPDWVIASRGGSLATGPGDFGGVTFAHSCNLGFRRALTERCGNFDETLRAGEDIEWSFRATRAGATLTFVEDALVHYRYRTTLRSLFRQARGYGRVNPIVAARLRAAGVPVSSGSPWRNWAWLARHISALTRRNDRARWVWVAGGRIGDAEARARLPWARPR